MAPNKALDARHAMGIPPRTPLNRVEKQSISRFPNCPEEIKHPAKTKNGIAIRLLLVTPSNMEVKIL